MSLIAIFTFRVVSLLNMHMFYLPVICLSILSEILNKDYIIIIIIIIIIKKGSSVALCIVSQLVQRFGCLFQLQRGNYYSIRGLTQARVLLAIPVHTERSVE